MINGISGVTSCPSDRGQRINELCSRRSLRCPWSASIGRRMWAISAKVARERLIKESGLPFSIVRVTQFFEFAGGVVGTPTTDGVVRLPGAGVQPMAAKDVAVTGARTAVAEPVNGIAEIGGPRCSTSTNGVAQC
jgi:hypothetical protein